MGDIGKQIERREYEDPLAAPGTAEPSPEIPAAEPETAPALAPA